MFPDYSHVMLRSSIKKEAGISWQSYVLKKIMALQRYI